MGKRKRSGSDEPRKAAPGSPKLDLSQTDPNGTMDGSCRQTPPHTVNEIPE
jgi:hypothetical protein